MELTLNTILLPTDFSEFSEKAFPYARSIARRFDAELRLVHILERPQDVPWWLAEQEYQARRGTLKQEAKDHLAEVVSRHLPDVRVTPEVRVGPPADEIVAAAAESSADLIVLATHGRGGLTRVLFGSVAERVVRQAPCPVLTVRPDQGAHE